MGKLTKLNLGSGPDGIKGWINYDWGLLPILGIYPGMRRILIIIGWLSNDYAVKWPKIRLVDIRNELPLEKSSIDYIYCSHVLEHFEKYQTLKILKECRRVLKKNGIIRLVLPDLEKLIKNYADADEFCREFYGFEKDRFWGGKKYFIRGHQWMYDQKSIINVLKDAGFKEINIKDFGIGECPDINKLDLAIHKKLSMYIEAK